MLMLSSGSIWTATRTVIGAPSRLPGIDDVARPAAGRKQQHIDADRVVRSGVAMRNHFNGGGDAAQAIFVDRQRQFGRSRAPLDLDERDRPPAPGYQVYLAPRRLHPPGDDAPSVQAQPPGGPAFAAPAALLGKFALHLISSARA